MQGENSAWIKFIILAIIAFVIWWLLHLIFGKKAKASTHSVAADAAQGIRAAGADAGAGLDRAGEAARRGADNLGGDLRAGAGVAAAGLGAAAAAAGAGLDRAGDAVREGADDLAGGLRGAADDVSGAAGNLAGEADAALGRAKDRVEDAGHHARHHAQDAANGAAGAVAGLDMPSADLNLDLAGAIDAVPGAVGGLDLPGGLDARGLGVDAAAALGGVGAALGADAPHHESIGEKIGEFIEGIAGNAGALTDFDADGTPDLPGMEEIEGEIGRGAAAAASGARTVGEEIVGGREFAVGADGSLDPIPFPAGGRDGIPHPHADAFGDGGEAFIHEGGALGGELIDGAAIAAAGHIAAEEIVGGREFEVSDGGDVELKASFEQTMPAPPRLAGTFTSNAEATLYGASDDRVVNLGRREPGERASLAGSDTLWEVMEKANPPREPGDTAPRPEDARMYIASSYAGAFERGGGITAWTWDEGAVDDQSGVANPRGGTCPRDYPIKGNRNSMIYHESWMGTWLPTVPEVCFRTADAAEAAGFRRPRNAQNAGPDQAPLIAQALASAWHSSDPMPAGMGIAAAAEAEVVMTLPGGAVWATGGECPADYPLKGNLDSNLYHAPGWPSFQATIAEVCFPDIITAEDAGYDWPKNAEGYPGAGSYKSKGRAAGEPKQGSGKSGSGSGSGGSGSGSGSSGDARQGVKAGGGDGHGEGHGGKSGGKGYAGGASSATASHDGQGRALPAGAHWASDGTCPSSMPIKGNLSSMLYHRPGTQFYANTDPEVCFASEADAEAAGYQLPPSQRDGASRGGGGSDAKGGRGDGGGKDAKGGSGGGSDARQGVKAQGSGSGSSSSGGAGDDADDEGKETRSGRKAPKGTKLPQGDTCPESYPVKGNMDSMLYHAPGWPSYSATIPEVCYRTTQAAAASGFSRPKNAPDN
jgi:hypothetical protein